MEQGPEAVVEFGPFRLEPARRVLTRQGTPIRLGSRAFEILLVLIERAPQMVDRKTLFERAWRGTLVEESNLRYQISTLRGALGGGNQYISTVAGQGYCFVAPLSYPAENAAALPRPAGTAAGAEEAAEGELLAKAEQTNLPHSLAEIIGRERELAELQEWLGRSRLVSLVGPGGAGKTRLAVELGRRVLSHYAGGVWLIDLAPLRDDAAVASATASILQVPVQKADAVIETIVAALGQERRLLIFDNCEHLIDAAASLIRTLLERVPGLSVLATSQQDLHLAAERLYAVGPLEVPPLGAVEIGEFAAAEFFVARSRAVDQLFELHDGNSGDVGEICRHLDGLPLALEMAAGHIRMLGIDGLRKGLNDRLKLLKGTRTADARHGSLYAMLEWSHGLLSPFEQLVFRRLAAFPGGFSLEAAITVAGDECDEPWEVVEPLGQLLDRSLVTLAQREPPRYRLLETLRLYATEKLQASGEAETVAERHARYFSRLLVQADKAWDVSADDDWIAAYQPLIDDARAAIEWALARPSQAELAVDLAGAAARLYWESFLWLEWRGYCERALPLVNPATPPLAAARLYRAAGGFGTDDIVRAQFAKQAADLYRQAGDNTGWATAMVTMAAHIAFTGRLDDAGDALHQAERELSGSECYRLVARLLRTTGMVAVMSGDSVTGKRYFLEALHIAQDRRFTSVEINIFEWLIELEFLAGEMDEAIQRARKLLGRRKPGDPYAERTRHSLACYLALQGELPEARSHAEQALTIGFKLGEASLLSCLQLLCLLAALDGRHEDAARLWGFVAPALEGSRPHQAPPLSARTAERLIGQLEAGLSGEEIEALAAEGARWSQDEAIAFAKNRLIYRR